MYFLCYSSNSLRVSLTRLDNKTDTGSPSFPCPASSPIPRHTEVRTITHEQYSSFPCRLLSLLYVGRQHGYKDFLPLFHLWRIVQEIGSPIQDHIEEIVSYSHFHILLTSDAYTLQWRASSLRIVLIMDYGILLDNQGATSTGRAPAHSASCLFFCCAISL